jgi:hypothetical protein
MVDFPVLDGAVPDRETVELVETFMACLTAGEPAFVRVPCLVASGLEILPEAAVVTAETVFLPVPLLAGLKKPKRHQQRPQTRWAKLEKSTPMKALMTSRPR